MENQQKWLTDKLIGKWMDKDHIIDTVLMESLIHYFDVEMGGNLGCLQEDAWKAEFEAGHVDEEYVQGYAELHKAYDYVKFERPKLEAQIESMDACQSRYNLMMELEKKDEEIIPLIFKNRHRLWT
jgi:hypothetical protein